VTRSKFTAIIPVPFQIVYIVYLYCVIYLPHWGSVETLARVGEQTGMSHYELCGSNRV